MSEKNDPPLLHAGVLYAPYFNELAESTRTLPGQTDILHELEVLRNLLPQVLSQIRSVNDRRALKKFYDQLAGELLAAGSHLLPIKYMSRSATWLSAAAEGKEKAATSGRLRDFHELSKVIGDSSARQSYDSLAPFFRFAQERSQWFAKWRASETAANARAPAFAVRKAMRRARLLASVRWNLALAAYFSWSFVLLVLGIGMSVDYGNEELVNLLAPYVDGKAYLIEWAGKIVLLLVVAWWLVERFKPYLERWQERFEKSQVEKFASDVMNAQFKIRICQALVEIAFFDAKSAAFPNQPSRDFMQYFLKWSIPEIESLNGLRPLA
jgi:hypothetical protein